MTRSHLWLLALLVGCSGSMVDLDDRPDARPPAPVDGSAPADGGDAEDDAGTGEPDDDAGTGEPDDDAGTSEPDDDAGTSEPDDAGMSMPVDAGAPPPPCRTRITYGSTWIRSDSRTTDYDDVSGVVTWDGVCHRDGGNSYAVLSNGWRPYFRGPTSCIIALDTSGSCSSPPPSACSTRVTYGSSWIRAASHPSDYDDVRGIVTWDGICHASGSNSSAHLSNGWQPHFSGSNACAISMRYTQCGGLYANPVVDSDCPDPGVTYDGTQYVMVCTGGRFPLRTSRDLVHWTSRGAALSAHGSWTRDSRWAPEIHRVGSRWILYYSARNDASGTFALGAATSSSSTGPFTDIGRPLLTAAAPGIIDVHRFEAPDGKHYLLWKVDGNAVRQPTPIYIQELAADGLSVVGSRTEILRNTLAWEGPLVEGVWMIHHDGWYYLFYSGNAYYNSSYAVGVARSRSPTGPFTKRGAPIMTSNSAWHGPGHGSIVRGPRGDWIHVYHSWYAGQTDRNPPGRVVLVDRITWADGWPRMLSAPTPSTRSQPMP